MIVAVEGERYGCRSPHDPRTLDESDETAVIAVVPVVTENEVMAGRDFRRRMMARDEAFRQRT